MTVEVECVLNPKRQIELLSPRRLDALKEAHHPGDMLRAVFTDETEGLHDRAFRLFHALRDEFADAAGLDKEEAKALLKHRHGKSIPYVDGFVPPLGERGGFFMVSGQLVWLKSTTVMTTDELSKLIMGAERDMGEL